MAVELYPHQRRISKRLADLIDSKGLAILQAPERSGKTLAVIDAIEKLDEVRRVLWSTKKAAIEGIEGDLKLYGATKEYAVVNPERLHKVEGRFDLIVVDEFHYAFSSFPKTPAKAKTVRELWSGTPTILVSATPASESASQWFHPLWMGGIHAFAGYRNFYEWARAGYVRIQRRNIIGRTVNDYADANAGRVMDEVQPYLIQVTWEETGVRFRPEIVSHYVELSGRTRGWIERLKRDRVLGRYRAETPMALVNGCYQLECGTLKVGEEYIDSGERELVDYIKARWGDTPDVAIMCRWVGQRRIMEREFSRALILSSHAHAEGVELSHIEHLVVASIDYSTARFQQRNARQASAKRTTPIRVHMLMSRGQVSEAVYRAVALKHQDFKARMFTGNFGKR